MSDTFQPRNDLEEKLVATHEGRMAQDGFVKALMEEQVFMPVLDDSTGIQGLQKSSKAQPLTLQEEGGTQVLILFSSPDRAKPFVQNFPGYEKGGLLTDFSWIVERIGSGVGIALNPGWEMGMDFEPDMVAALTHQTPGETPPA